MGSKDFTTQHFEAFGRITHFYASAEIGLKLCLSGMLGIQLVEVMVLTDRVGGDAMRKVAKAIAKERLSAPLAKKFGHLVGGLQTHARLRNHIAHHRWTKGTRLGAMRPALVSTEKGKLEFFGYDEDDKDYTLDELITAADDLLRLNQSTIDFLKTSGLMEKVERHSKLPVRKIRGPRGTAKGRTP